MARRQGDTQCGRDGAHGVGGEDMKDAEKKGEAQSIAIADVDTKVSS